jgi:hypothetical protein
MRASKLNEELQKLGVQPSIAETKCRSVDPACKAESALREEGSQAIPGGLDATGFLGRAMHWRVLTPDLLVSQQHIFFSEKSGFQFSTQFLFFIACHLRLQHTKFSTEFGNNNVQF